LFYCLWLCAGAILKLVGDTMEAKKFKAQPHPYSIPGFLDAFTWSLPFVAQRGMLKT